MNRSLHQRIQDRLDESDIAYFVGEAGTLMVTRYSQVAMLHALIRPREEDRHVAFTVFAGICLPYDRRLEVAEWVLRTNLVLMDGRFDFDLDYGDVRFVRGIYLDEPFGCDDRLERLLDESFGTMEHHLLSLMAVGFGGRPAIDAIESVEVLDLPPGPEFDRKMRILLDDDRPSGPPYTL